MFTGFIMVCALGTCVLGEPAKNTGFKDKAACTAHITQVADAEMRSDSYVSFKRSYNGKMYFGCVERPDGFDFYDDKAATAVGNELKETGAHD